MSAETDSVFFYGLFMDEELLEKQGIQVLSSAVGYVEGFTIAIGERATLLPEVGSQAYGVLMQLNPGSATALYEGQGLTDYVAETVTVQLPGNCTANAVCYNLPAKKPSGKNRAYAAALLALAARLELPDSYLEHLKAQSIADRP
jgi:hypothetical protein